MQPCCHCCSLCSKIQVLALSALVAQGGSGFWIAPARPGITRPSPASHPCGHRPMRGHPPPHASCPGSPSSLRAAAPLHHSPNCPVSPDTYLLGKLTPIVQDLVPGEPQWGSTAANAHSGQGWNQSGTGLLLGPSGHTEPCLQAHFGRSRGREHYSPPWLVQVCVWLSGSRKWFKTDL